MIHYNSCYFNFFLFSIHALCESKYESLVNTFPVHYLFPCETNSSAAALFIMNDLHIL